MMRAIAIVLLAACATQACAGGAPNTERQVPRQAQASALGEVKARTLRNDQCTMVLMTRSEPSTRVLLAFDRPAQAVARVGEYEARFERVSFSGLAAFGHAETQVWRSDSGEEIKTEVRFDAVPSDPSGAVIRSGSLGFTSRTGETLVIPVVGLVSCGANAR
jgi:hypothetical protein